MTARLFDTLLYLVQNSERLVERDELACAVWADRAVAEGNLQKAVSSLRKVLQTRAPSEVFIRTVPGRGFGSPCPCYSNLMRLAFPLPIRSCIPMQRWRLCDGYGGDIGEL